MERGNGRLAAAADRIAKIAGKRLVPVKPRWTPSFSSTTLEAGK
jgi:hypothetical protein